MSGAMIEDSLREKLRKIETLFAGGATAGEKAAAGAAAERIRARLGNAARGERPEKIKCSVPDSWSRQLFIALCRRYGLRPFRCPRMHNQTVIIKAPRSFVEQVLWPEFQELRSASPSVSYARKFTVRCKMLRKLPSQSVSADEEGIGTRLRLLCELDTLVPAYAATIHKSQGSEYAAVVIPVMTQHYAMLQRNLHYTGVTRGKRLVVLVGQKKAVAIAVKNVSGRRRWSKLNEWLRA